MELDWFMICCWATAWQWLNLIKIWASLKTFHWQWKDLKAITWTCQAIALVPPALVICVVKFL